MYARRYVCVNLYVCMYVCTYVIMYVCTYVIMYVCTYVIMYVRTYVCIYINISSSVVSSLYIFPNLLITLNFAEVSFAHFTNVAVYKTSVFNEKTVNSIECCCCMLCSRSSTPVPRWILEVRLPFAVSSVALPS